jgi:hypothetical protein
MRLVPLPEEDSIFDIPQATRTFDWEWLSHHTFYRAKVQEAIFDMEHNKAPNPYDFVYHMF